MPDGARLIVHSGEPPIGAKLVEHEKRPFSKGERVYLLYGPGAQEPGTTCQQSAIIEDDGRADVVLLMDGRWFPVERVRRDRRGQTPPVYSEVPTLSR